MASADPAAPASDSPSGPLRIEAIPGSAWRWVRATDIRTALGIGAVALVVRIIWVLAVHRDGFAFNDAFFYHSFAVELADGNGYQHTDGTPTAAWPPAWPFMLSMAVRAAGDSALSGEILNAILGAASVPLLFLVARRAFDRSAAVFCAWGLALLPGQIYLTDVLLSETFNTLLVIALFALLSVVPARRWAATLAGLVIGVLTLTRGENLFLVVVPLVVWWPLLAPRERLVRFGIVSICAVLVLAPWTVRNVAQLDAFVVLSTNAGQTLYSGHNPTATGGPTYAPDSLLAPTQALPVPQREVEADRLLRRYARKWALENPEKELLLIPKRFLALIEDDGQALPIWVNPGASGRPALGPQATRRLSLAAALAWYSLLAGFVLALVLGGRRLVRAPAGSFRRVAIHGSLAWIAVTVVFDSVVLFGQWRYHMALEPLMLLVTAPVATSVWTARNDLRERLFSRL